ncbi:MAG: glycerophosphodiester phosphodiesterase family protein [Verrucomicrobiae bacterium]|nr:glycerophosphodiester phosphodiesterase family protein [Verrucomicrobiae bacterium]
MTLSRLGLVVLFIGFLPAVARSESTRARDLLGALADPDDRTALIAAHRGGYADDREDQAPENSVANIAVAIARGFDCYETDIRRTADGVFVVVHDDTLDRETDGSGPVEALTYAQVKKLRKRYRDASLSPEPVAILEALLTAGRQRLLFKPDLKPGVIDHFDELAKLIDRLGMNDQVFLRTSWKDAEVIAAHFEKGTPKVEVMFKVKTVAQVKAAAAQFSPRTIQVDVEKGETLSNEKREAIRVARELGMVVETHAYNDPDQWADLLRAGVRMFHTASPDATLAWLKEHQWRQALAGTVAQ